MRNFTTCLFLFFFCIFLSAFGNASDFSSKILEKADLFYEKKDYAKAELFYDTFLVEDQSCDISFKSASCKFYLGQYDKAASILKDITDKCDKSLKIKAYYLLYRVNVERGEPGLAFVDLSNMEQLDKSTRGLIKFEKLWFHTRFGKVDRALSEIRTMDSDFKEKYKIADYEQTLENMKKEVKSPFLGGLYSIVPGGGYLYCGRYKDTAISFFLNSILGFSSYEAFDNDMPAVGVLFGAAFLSFYSGNIYGGIRAAKLENKLYRKKLYEDLDWKFRTTDRKLLLKFRLYF